jgi:ribosome-binding factor A
VSRKSRSGSGAAGAPPSQRALRVGELIRHALSDILTHGLIHDPAFDGLVVTVPEVRMTSDLRTATVFVVSLGGKGNDTLVEAFERNARFLRGEIAHRVSLRYAPDLRFRLDTSFDEGDKIDTLLKAPGIRRDLDSD